MHLEKYAPLQTAPLVKGKNIIYMTNWYAMTHNFTVLVRLMVLVTLTVTVMAMVMVIVMVLWIVLVLIEVVRWCLAAWLVNVMMLISSKT